MNSDLVKRSEREGAAPLLGKRLRQRRRWRGPAWPVDWIAPPATPTTPPLRARDRRKHFGLGECFWVCGGAEIRWTSDRTAVEYQRSQPCRLRLLAAGRGGDEPAYACRRPGETRPSAVAGARARPAAGGRP